MRQIWMCAVLLSTTVFAAEENPVKSTVASVGLFKNGVAYVKRELKVPGPGTYILDDVPEPVHGTWFVQSDAQIETRVTTREVSEPLRADSNLDFQKLLAGKQVTIHFREGQIPPATGKVEAINEAKGNHWNRTYERPHYDYWGNFAGNMAPPVANPARYLILQTEAGRVFVDSGMIAYVKSDNKDEVVVRQKRPVLIFTTDKAAAITVSYLTKGMAWAPSYRVDISDPKSLTIEQDATVKNELMDIEGTELQLISGFPSVRFSHVLSPLSPNTNWAAFFQQLNNRVGGGGDASGNAVYQQVLSNNDRGPRGVDLSATPTGEGVDIFYQSIGARTMKEGDSLSLMVAKDKSQYERIVEWQIPDTRNEYGHYIEDYARRQDPDKYDDAAWDSVRFRNPFKFPMTTGPATVVSGDRFNGQQMSFWVNSGEETCLHVTKALSVRTRSVEREEPGSRDTVFIGARQYQKTSVKGELTINNHRKEDITIVIRRNFSGDLISADGEPKKTLREEGAYSVNARNELNWTLTLKAGEEKTFAYRYSVLINR